MYRTLIIDSESNHSRVIKKMLQENYPQIEIVGISKDLTSAKLLIAQTDPKLVIMEVVFGKSNAFDFLDKISPYDFELIFLTSNEKYSFKAIKYNALDFIIKPISLENLQICIQKSIQKIREKYINKQLDLLLTNIKSVQNNINQKIPVPTIEGFVFLVMHEIIRCEANGAYTCIYTTRKEKILTSKNIKEYEDLLPKLNFFRIHNSHIINLNRISKYNKGRGGTVTMEDGTQIEVASRRRSDFLNVFNY